MADKKQRAKASEASKSRRAPRIKSINLVSYARHNDRLKVDEDGGVARTVNMSETGILLETYSPLPIESVLEVDISLGEKLVTITGEVTRAETVDKGVYRLAIQFKETPGSAGMQMLRDYLSSRST
ncbi:MAG: PilZ domain-containing protein [Acidobacteriota bacterium]